MLEVVNYVSSLAQRSSCPMCQGAVLSAQLGQQLGLQVPSCPALALYLDTTGGTGGTWAPWSDRGESYFFLGVFPTEDPTSQKSCTEREEFATTGRILSPGYLNVAERLPTVLVTRARIFNHPTGTSHELRQPEVQRCIRDIHYSLACSIALHPRSIPV